MIKIYNSATLIYICLQIVFVSARAQVLYGTTTEGGKANEGTINKFDLGSKKFEVVKFFERTPFFPFSDLTEKDGKLYGTANLGGSSNHGVIFSFEPSSSTFTKLHDFDSAGGANPYGGLVKAPDGKFYGMTNKGGSNNVGVIFSFDPSSLSFKKLKDFVQADGASPFGSLISAKDGKLYGMTHEGGSSNSGVVFSFDPSSSVYTKLKNLNIADGSLPYGSLLEANDGKLYGLTYKGGTHLAGVIFSFDPSSSTYAKLNDFDNINGSSPYGNLVQAKNGKLYGVTTRGGSIHRGAIFSFDPATSNITKLIDFANPNGGPKNSLTVGVDGKLYGILLDAGAAGTGTLFSLDPLNSSYAELKKFAYESDYNTDFDPYGSLLQSRDGKMYGLSPYSGSKIDFGFIYSFDPSTSAFSNLKDFNFSTGGHPAGSLVQASNGKLYGIGGIGSFSSNSALFSIDPATSTFTLLADSLSSSFGNLIQASDGKLYGMTRTGGSGDGYIFSYQPSSSTFTKLKDFINVNGANPSGSLVEARDGKLYGMTGYGGSSDNGVIFSFDPATSSYMKLKDFDQVNGSHPFGNLIEGGDGKLYGLTYSGGSNGLGVIFSFEASTLVYRKLIDLDFATGCNALGSLLKANDGKLYGTTYSGGSNLAGVIFSFDPATSTYKKLKDFIYTDGANPCTLMQASDGKLYGATNSGGIDGYGVIFSFDPSTLIYTKLKEYNGNNGARPGPGFAFIEITSTDKPPRVKIASPVEEAKYTANATVILSADASDEDGKVKTVSFYNGNKLIFTELAPPFYRKWFNVKEGDYTITARATDNDGNVTTSAPVHFTVLPSTSSSVNITHPLTKSNFSAGIDIVLSADAFAPGIGISRIEFYEGPNLIFTEYKAPYYNKWRKVTAGNYSIRAKLTDNNGNAIYSQPVVITVTGTLARSIIREEAAIEPGKSLNLKLNPNPVAHTLNISVNGFKENTKSAISIISASGVIVKTIQSHALNGLIKFDVSSLSNGPYFIRLVNGGKIIYRKFVKL
jgi:uncharacterized repeat protein (TIGR03803 family)